ncbi:MAG TPA: glycosyltransferase [Candidatus Saccharimonadales bacterium]|nr:glycosyltransferase [Candidatus Saccharimonadales bacterium]
MRIILGTMSYPPQVSGVAVFVRQLSEFLAEAGHEVHIVAPANQLKSFTERRGEIIIHRLRAWQNPLRRGFYIPLFVKKQAEALIREIQPDVIHVNDPLAMSRYLQRAGRKIGVPTVVSNHFLMDYILAYFPKFLRRLLAHYLRNWMNYFYNECDVVVAPSQSAVEALKRLGTTAPLVALSNGVDLHRFFVYSPLEEIRAKFSIPHRPIVLYVGRVDPDKSVNVLIQAFQQLLARRPAQLVLVGGGTKAAAIMKDARQRLGEFVTFTGPVAHESEDLVALYQLCDIFCMPSSIETQSISTLEAMAAGKPIVAADGGALPELVQNHQNGLLFAPGDAMALGALLEEVLANPAEQEHFGAVSLERIAHHELERSLGLYVTLYLECREKSLLEPLSP